MKQFIAISSGDINGIGPEIILKTFADYRMTDTTPVILSSEQVMRFYTDKLDIDLPFHIIQSMDEAKSDTVNILECYQESSVMVQPGELSSTAGACAMQAVEKGIDLCKTGKVDALVTAPISKEAVNRAGYDIPGHTEFLAEHTQTTDFMMMLVNDSLRVGLASIHIPVSEVARTLNRDTIIRQCAVMDASLKQDFIISDPRIAVLGLNPHAGDGGIIGREEIDMIRPAIQELNQQGIKADGPHAADGFFGNQKHKAYDGILAMYHDQGMIPFKTLSFGQGVNFTAGLPIIRTSPDHGTAFDIAGRGQANPSSFKQALYLAVDLANNRNR